MLVNLYSFGSLRFPHFPTWQWKGDSLAVFFFLKKILPSAFCHDVRPYSGFSLRLFGLRFDNNITL